MREDFNPGVIRLIWGSFNVLTHPGTLYFLAATYLAPKDAVQAFLVGQFVYSYSRKRMTNTE